ncbi:protein kinase [bacterium]|nr:protein kinase [bacterium]
MTLKPNQDVLHFRIVEKIGEGGMGEVWRARDTRLDRDVAIKVMSTEALGDDERRARFRGEALSLSKLNHPNIATIHDFVAEGDLDLLVMEYVRGEGLDERLQGEPLADDEVVRLGVELADGLEAAHRQGIVHRDLKPANLRITEDGRLKILDFGLAKLATDADSGPDDATRTAAALTAAGAVVGTIPYMAPEQLRAQPVDARTDIFAAGAVLYEAATARRAHPANTTAETIDAVLNKEPARPTTVQGAVSPRLERVLLKALSKNPDDRYQSAAELREALQQTLAPSMPTTVSVFRRPWFLATAALVLLALVAVIAMQAQRSARVRWAREEAIPEIERVVTDLSRSDDGSVNWPAYRLATEAASVLGDDDPVLAGLFEKLTLEVRLESDPPGAAVFIRPYVDGAGEWEALGSTPIEKLRLPVGFSRVRYELEGFATHEDVFWVNSWAGVDVAVTLHPSDAVPDGMTWIRPYERPLGLPGLEGLETERVEAFWADRHEVTHREYKRFVDAGGYQDPSYWNEPVRADGRELTFDEAIARFQDRTGRPGPATWEAGDYPDGADDLPVGGVSWYEAAAYAAFAGKQLPTIFHWNSMALTYGGPVIIPPSTFLADRPTAVGTRAAIHVGGTRDLAGNVREWCRNENSRTGERFILGGGWNDPPYAFNDAYAQPALDRSETNGFRCIQPIGDATLPESMTRTIELPFRDFFVEQPVDDRTHQLYLDQYAYDPTPLNAEVESRTEEEDWIVERVSFDATYGDERMTAFVFLPKAGVAASPYPAVVIFPGSGVIHQRGNEEAARSRVPEWIVKSGRAVVFPIYKGTLDRGGDLTTDQPSETNRYRDYVRMWVHDMSRTVDYLETRDDIDAERLAYMGFSWGGRMGPLMLGVEPRFKTALLVVAGLKFQRALPEADPFNYVTRVTMPVLMINGRNDFFFPLETSQRPLFELLGTPEADKKWVVFDGGHSVPRTQQIKESLDWLDRYLGP